MVATLTTRLPDDEILPAHKWAVILGVTDRHIRRACGLQPSRSQLREDWREKINALMVEQSVTSCHALHNALTAGRVQWRPRKKKIELRPDAQQRAEKIQSVVQLYYKMRSEGSTARAAELAAIALSGSLFSKPWTDRTVRNWIERIEERGGADAPMEAYADGRNGAAKTGKPLPADFFTDCAAKFLDSSKGIRSAENIRAEYEAQWIAGMEIPGLGSREGRTPFPFTLRQIQSCAPSRASRISAGRGKFQAKAAGYLAAPPNDWSDVEPVRVVYFDDKVLDVLIMTDDGRKAFRPHIYIAYDGGTRRVLAFIVREENKITQLDVEGLQAAVLRDHGLGGDEAGWMTRWVKERGTVSISPARKQFLESLFPGRLEIDRTMMIGGKSAPGDWTQKASGNFFGKAVLEAFMGSLDHLAKHLPAQTGNIYSVQPAIIGDTQLTLEKLINSARQGYKPARSLMEEGILTAAMARVLDFMETGENVTAHVASQRTGVKPPMMYFTDFVAALGELFRAFNNRRGHRMQGFGKVRVEHPNNGLMIPVTESPNDKAERMLDTMRLQGRFLVRPHDADIAAILHKVKRVTLTANGTTTEDNVYWDPLSNACREAASIAGGKKTFLALYNPVAPAALYLLANPPSHLPANATEIPEDFKPQLLEVLPLYEAPSPVDKVAQRKRHEQVASFNARVGREILLRAEPILMQRTEEREILKDRLEPLRATIRSAAPPVAPEILPASGIATTLAEAEALVRDHSTTREQQREEAIPGYIARMAAKLNESPVQQ